MCGDYLHKPHQIRPSQGSPPRVRGLPFLLYLFPYNSRITPACAGTTRGTILSRICAGDHPRVCGDYSERECHWYVCLGSPPRVRGLLIHIRHCSIPPMDHPRVCGDYDRYQRKTYDSIGSPPRVRGLRSSRETVKSSQGITPACAGTTRFVSFPHRQGQDHPRVCGDYYTVLTVRLARPGSPPRVRGLLLSILWRRGRGRITPACAGTTWRRGRAFFDGEDHPRVCGDYQTHQILQNIAKGSPPRVRGLRNVGLRFTCLTGITPACAGTTAEPLKKPNTPKDHPRVCGDYLAQSMVELLVLGSPPRVRGLQILA